MSSMTVVKWKCGRNPQHTAEVEYDPEAAHNAPKGWAAARVGPLDGESFPPYSKDLCEGCSRQVQSFLMDKDNVPSNRTRPDE